MPDDDTYAILIEGFHATLAGARAVVDLRLAVTHPGPDFADDISSVMSYEGVIDILRRLEAETTDQHSPRDVAEHAARQLRTLPKVREARVRLTLPQPNGGSLGCEVVTASA